MRIEMGDTARDSITGFTGKVMAITTWYNSCRRLSLQATDLDKDGKPMELQSFDEQQLELVEQSVADPEKSRPEPTPPPGGPRPDPRRW